MHKRIQFGASTEIITAQPGKVEIAYIGRGRKRGLGKLTLRFSTRISVAIHSILC